MNNVQNKESTKQGKKKNDISNSVSYKKDKKIILNFR